jgi:hypothetical protein
MNRKDKREFLRKAKQHGFDPSKPDLSVVTAPYTKRYISVVTEQSTYLIDLQTRTARRNPGDEASHLSHDSEWYPYEDIYSCSVSFPLRMTWKDGERLLYRETTPIIRVDELDVLEEN